MEKKEICTLTKKPVNILLYLTKQLADTKLLAFQVEDMPVASRSWKRQGNTRVSAREYSPAQTLLLASKIHGRFLTYRTIK